MDRLAKSKEREGRARDNYMSNFTLTTHTHIYYKAGSLAESHMLKPRRNCYQLTSHMALT